MEVLPLADAFSIGSLLKARLFYSRRRNFLLLASTVSYLFKGIFKGTYSKVFKVTYSKYSKGQTTYSKGQTKQHKVFDYPKGQTKQHKVLDYLDFGVQCKSDETGKIFESVAEFV